MSEYTAFSLHLGIKDHLAYPATIITKKWMRKSCTILINCIEIQSRNQRQADGFDRAYKYHGNWAETLILECFRIIRNKSITLFLYVRLCGKSSKNTT